MLTEAEEMELLALLEEEGVYQEGRKLWTYFPEAGPLRRELYEKHMEFFREGWSFPERMFTAGNRVGKTESAGLYELTLHLTGQYPDWWEGRRFPGPIRAWAAGDTNQTVRDIIQAKLLGPADAPGTGVLPRESLLGTSPKSGVPGALEMVRVQHVSGRTSVLGFKTYEQGRKAFEGTEQDVILLDEEPPMSVYAECLLRTMRTASFEGGIVMLTFTPLLHLSDVVLHFMPDGQVPEGPQTGHRYVVNAGWDDVPHLSEEEKERMAASIPPWQLDARRRGLPTLGAGIIYPVPEEDYLIDDFELPRYWLRAYALDVGWNRTAALFGAYDRESDTWYLYNEYYRGQAEPSVHASAIRARGEWMGGVIDSSARGRSQVDGTQLMQQYEDLGLKLELANKAIESGLYYVWERLSTGRLKVFKSLANWRRECRLYRRDENGNIVKKDDHLMDDTRYLVLSGLDVARPVPVKEEPEEFAVRQWGSYRTAKQAWMG